MDPPNILIIILNYRTPQLALRAVGATLAAMETINGEVLLIDNDSQDESEALLTEGAKAAGWERVRFLQTGQNGGFGAGNNAGIRAGLSDGTAPDYVYILNPDAVPEPEAISALLSHLEAHPRTALAGSFIYGPPGPGEVPEDCVHNTAFRFPGIWSELEGAAHFGPLSRLLYHHVVAMEIPKKTVEVDWVAGASLMMRREMLDQVGLFDEGFFLYFEETDLCLRARRAGWRTAYVRESRVSHIGSVSTGMKAWTRVPRYWFDSRERYFAKNHGRAYAAIATVFHVLGALFWRARRLVDPKARASPAGPKRFLADLVGHALNATLRGPVAKFDLRNRNR